MQKEHNRVLKSKVYDAEKSSRIAHENMVKLEQTIRDLKRIQNDEKTANSKSKQTEKLNQAADKIDELVQANQYLNEAKDKAVKMTG